MGAFGCSGGSGSGLELLENREASLVLLAQPLPIRQALLLLQESLQIGLLFLSNRLLVCIPAATGMMVWIIKTSRWVR